MEMEILNSNVRFINIFLLKAWTYFPTIVLENTAYVQTFIFPKACDKVVFPAYVCLERY